MFDGGYLCIKKVVAASVASSLYTVLRNGGVCGVRKDRIVSCPDYYVVCTCTLSDLGAFAHIKSSCISVGMFSPD